MTGRQQPRRRAAKARSTRSILAARGQRARGQGGCGDACRASRIGWPPRSRLRVPWRIGGTMDASGRPALEVASRRRGAARVPALPAAVYAGRSRKHTVLLLARDERELARLDADDAHEVMLAAAPLDARDAGRGRTVADAAVRAALRAAGLRDGRCVARSDMRRGSPFASARGAEGRCDAEAEGLKRAIEAIRIANEAQEKIMAVQQNKKSPSKRGMHRAHDFLTAPALAVEPVTGEAHLRHHISPNGLSTAARRSSRPRPTSSTLARGALHAAPRRRAFARLQVNCRQRRGGTRQPGVVSAQPQAIPTPPCRSR